jgi:hypothetical protein
MLIHNAKQKAGQAISTQPALWLRNYLLRAAILALISAV